MKPAYFLLGLFLVLSDCTKKDTTTSPDPTDRKLKALIIDGQNNHGIWPKTTIMMKDYLEETGLFTVDVERTVFTWQGPHNDSDPGMSKEKRMELITVYPINSSKETIPVDKPKSDSTYVPDFSKYDVVISNFGWTAAPWPAETQRGLEKFVSNGGGLIIIHAADNSFPEWLEYNKMIGLGGWGDRTEKDGPFVYYDGNNTLVHDTSPGGAGSHGRQYEFLITLRDTLHPITKGMPVEWLHAQDELYDRLRGPAENLTVLGTAFSGEEKNASHFSPLRGTDRHEPMMMAINYGEGRVFHTPLGHADYSMECVGFIVMLQRSCEWAATGKVSQKIPNDFPGRDKVVTRKYTK
jgi:uncharacterized protein